jgi:hypothetical protein
MKSFLFILLILFHCASPKPTKKSRVKTLGVCTSGNCVNGSGTFEYKNGDRYIGPFVSSLPEGEGLYINSQKESFSGSFKSGKLHGFASHYDSKRNLIYSGEWKDGKKSE